MLRSELHMAHPTGALINQYRAHRRAIGIVDGQAYKAIMARQFRLARFHRVTRHRISRDRTRGNQRLLHRVPAAHRGVLEGIGFRYAGGLQQVGVHPAVMRRRGWFWRERVVIGIAALDWEVGDGAGRLKRILRNSVAGHQPECGSHSCQEKKSSVGHPPNKAALMPSRGEGIM